MPVPRRKDSFWVTVAWGLNIAGLAAIALVLIAYWALNPVLAAPQNSQSVATAA